MSRDIMKARTDEALATGGFADMRPDYRAILRKLRDFDAAAFAEATRRFEEELVPAVADGGADPIAAWVAYGAWLALKLEPGRLLRLDESGLATPADPDPVPGHVLLYLPDEARQPAVPIVLPADPSPSQQAALELLAR